MQTKTKVISAATAGRFLARRRQASAHGPRTLDRVVLVLLCLPDAAAAPSELGPTEERSATTIPSRFNTESTLPPSVLSYHPTRLTILANTGTASHSPKSIVSDSRECLSFAGEIERRDRVGLHVAPMRSIH